MVAVDVAVFAVRVRVSAVRSCLVNYRLSPSISPTYNISLTTYSTPQPLLSGNQHTNTSTQKKATVMAAGGLQGVKAAAPQKAVWFGILMFSSVGMIMFNKLAMHSFHFPLSLLFFQNGLSCVLNVAAMRADLLSGNALKASEARHFVVPALLFAIMLGASLKALPLVTVASVIVFKNGSTILVAVGDMLVFGQRFHRHAYAGLGVMLCGAVVYGLGDHQYNATGYAWLAVNMVVNAVLNIYERYAVLKSENSPAVCSTYMNSLSLPFVLAAAVYQNETATVLSALADTTFGMRVCIVITGCLGFSISLAYGTAVPVLLWRSHVWCSLLCCSLDSASEMFIFVFSTLCACKSHAINLHLYTLQLRCSQSRRRRPSWWRRT
jgi:hypothetical protein